MSTRTVKESAGRRLALSLVSALALMAGLFIAPAQAAPATDIDVSFSNSAPAGYYSVTVTSDKGLSNLVFRYNNPSEGSCTDANGVDATKIEFGDDQGKTWTGNVAKTYMGKSLCGVFVKSGNNFFQGRNSTTFPGYGAFIHFNDWTFQA